MDGRQRRQGIVAVVGGWQVMAKALEGVPDMVIQGIFPWCFTPELYASRPDYIESLVNFLMSRPAQPLPAFMQQSNAVLTHDAEAQLGKIRASTQITFGRRDAVTSTRFADQLKDGIRNSELHIFEDCSHAPLYENVPASIRDVSSTSPISVSRRLVSSPMRDRKEVR